MPFIKNLAHARHRRDPAHRRSGAVSASASTTSTSTSRSSGSRFSTHAGRFAAHLFLLAGGGAEGLAESRRHRRSGDRCADRRDHRRRQPAGAGHRLPRARPRHPRRPLLDSALVQGLALDRLLGRVRPAGRPSRAMRAAFRKPGGTTATRRREDRASADERSCSASATDRMRTVDDSNGTVA